MSKTDKDAPDWVRQNNPEPGARPSHRHRDWHGNPRDCDIDAVSTAARPYGNCFWLEPEPPKMYVRINNFHEHRRQMYWKPERAKSRAAVRRLVWEFNTFGDVDDSGVIVDQAHRPWWD